MRPESCFWRSERLWARLCVSFGGAAGGRWACACARARPPTNPFPIDRKKTKKAIPLPGMFARGRAGVYHVCQQKKWGCVRAARVPSPRAFWEPAPFAFPSPIPLPFFSFRPPACGRTPAFLSPSDQRSMGASALLCPTRPDPILCQPGSCVWWERQGAGVCSPTVARAWTWTKRGGSGLGRQSGRRACTEE